MQYTLEKSHKKTKSQLGSVRQNVLISLTIRAFSRKLYFWPNQNQTTYSQRSKLSIELDEGFEKRRNPPRSTVGGKRGLLSLRREQSNLETKFRTIERLAHRFQQDLVTTLHTKETKERLANAKRKKVRQSRAIKKQTTHAIYIRKIP